MIFVGRLLQLSTRVNKAYLFDECLWQQLFNKYQIYEGIRRTAFVAQIAHESAGWSAFREIRSKASAERKYGVGTRVGRVLGNTEPGDGALFIGRGPIQLTGRSNYRQIGNLIGQPLEDDPGILEREPTIAVESAMAFWTSRKLNERADQMLKDEMRAYREITRRINGGYNGMKDRIHWLNKAKRVGF